MRWLRRMTVVWMLSVASAAWADGAQQVRIGIKGMVCAFCATGLKKTFTTELSKRFGAEKSVSAVSVSLEQRRVTLEVDPQNAPSDERIRELVKDAGYEVESIERTAKP